MFTKDYAFLGGVQGTIWQSVESLNPIGSQNHRRTHRHTLCHTYIYIYMSKSRPILKHSLCPPSPLPCSLLISLKIRETKRGWRQSVWNPLQRSFTMFQCAWARLETIECVCKTDLPYCPYLLPFPELLIYEHLK